MPSEFHRIVRNLTADTCLALRRAVEIGRWPDGRELTDEQRRLCMEAVLTWEMEHLPEHERTGYIPPVDCDSQPGREEERPVTLRPARGD